ncbi:hypothetical protein ACFCY8_10280 [Streptomyces noursei]|uniref:hypothetical protein n=1 Tax=Streptomyces noursei TaxID=1971 RepID=UPI0035DCFA2B
MSEMPEDRLTPETSASEARLRCVLAAGFPRQVYVDGALPDSPLVIQMSYLPAADDELAADPRNRDSIMRLEGRLRDRGVGCAFHSDDITPYLAVVIEEEEDAAGFADYLLETLPPHAVAASHLRLALGEAGIESEVRVSKPVATWARCEQCRRLPDRAPHLCHRCLPPRVDLGVIHPMNAVRWLGVVLADRDWTHHRPIGTDGVAHVGRAFSRNLGRVAREHLTTTVVRCLHHDCWQHEYSDALVVGERLSTAASNRLTDAVRAADGQAADGRPPGPTGEPLRSAFAAPTPEAAAHRLGHILNDVLLDPPKVCAVEDGVKVEPIHAEAAAHLLHFLPTVFCCWDSCGIDPAESPADAAKLAALFRNALGALFGEQVDVHVVHDAREEVPRIAISKPLREGLAHRLAEVIERSPGRRCLPGSGNCSAAAAPERS